MTRPVAAPLIRRRLILSYEISDGTEVITGERIVSHDLLDVMRKDVRGALLWNDTELLIKNAELAWASSPDPVAND